MSSRNRYLDEKERQVAPALHRALDACRGRILDGERNFSDLEAQGIAQLKADGLQPEYFSVRRAHDLAEPEASDAELVVLAAARLGKTRLIDNVLIDFTQSS